jgi:branched-chain amino acid aminotransferase
MPCVHEALPRQTTIADRYRVTRQPLSSVAVLDYRVVSNPNPAGPGRRAEIMANPGFGKYFTDHMLSITWTSGDGWHDARVEPYGPLSLDPACAVLHYAQEVFEGLKAYRHDDGSIWTFRPERNGARLQQSARRLALPELPIDDFVQSIETIVSIDKDWVPGGGEQSLYIRPFMIATEVFLGVRPSTEVRYMVICSPVGSYFAGGIKPVNIWLSSEYTRAALGGTGAAKCGGNYAAGLAAQIQATDHGCDQVCFLDAEEHRWIEELGGMNLYFVRADGTLVTPRLTGTILEGVTRSSILTLGEEFGLRPEERQVSIDEWRDGVASGEIREVFACGTAAVVTPVGRLVWDGGEVGSGAAGEITMQLRNRLIDLQYGRSHDQHGWLHRIV